MSEPINIAVFLLNNGSILQHKYDEFPARTLEFGNMTFNQSHTFVHGKYRWCIYQQEVPMNE